MRRLAAGLVLLSLAACGGDATAPDDRPPLGWYTYTFVYDGGAVGFRSGTSTVTGRFLLEYVAQDSVTGQIEGTSIFRPSIGGDGPYTSVQPLTRFKGFYDAAGYKVVAVSELRRMLALRAAAGGVTCAGTIQYTELTTGTPRAAPATCSVTRTP
jgi:hypothetical protein